MRTILIKQAMDLQQVGAKLVAKSANADTAMNALKTLNPHVDFKKIAAGTVLLVPDSPGFKTAESDSVEGDAFDDLAKQLETGVNDASNAAQQGWTDLLAEEKDLTAAFKLVTAAKRTDVDPAIKALIDAATQQFKTDQTNAKPASDSLKAMQSEVETELAELGKLLR